MTLNTARTEPAANGGAPAGFAVPLTIQWTESADPMFVIDESERIVLWNAAAEDLLGFTSDEALGARCHDIVRGLTTERRRFCAEDCSVNRCAARGSLPHAYDLLCPTKDGRMVWLEVRILVAQSDIGRLLVHTFHEVSEERRLTAYARDVLDRSSEVLARTAVDDDTGPATAGLTAREMEILHLLDAGTRPTEIASRLNISIRTARNHVQSIIGKLGVHSVLEAVAEARRHRSI